MVRVGGSEQLVCLEGGLECRAKGLSVCWVVVC